MVSRLKPLVKKIPPARWLVREIRRLARPGRFLVWHTPRREFAEHLFRDAARTLPGPMLDLASGKRRLGREFVNLDLQEASEVDVLGDACQLPFRSDCFSLVWCEAALEHVVNPVAVVAEIQRVLKPGGKVYVEVPFLQGFHADPFDYQRFTVEGLKHLFREFDITFVKACSGPASTFCYIANHFLASVFSFGHPWLHKVFFHYVFCYILYPIKFLDVFLIHSESANRCAFGYALLASLPPKDANKG